MANGACSGAIISDEESQCSLFKDIEAFDLLGELGAMEVNCRDDALYGASPVIAFADDGTTDMTTELLLPVTAKKQIR